MTQGAAGERSVLQLLRDPVFGPFFVAKLLSTAGIWTYNIVAAIVVYDITGSAFDVGLVSIAQFAPQLLLAPGAGAVADRWDRRKLLIIGRMFIVAGAGGLAVLMYSIGVAGLAGPGPIIAGAFVVGIGFAISSPAQNALIPSLVRPEDLAQAIALNTVPPTIARAAGPALGALIAATAGPEVAFALAAVANLAFAGILLRLEIRPNDPTRGDRRIRVGLLHLRSDPSVAILLLGIAAVALAADPVITLSPALAASFNGGPGLVGSLASAYGVGTGAAFLILHRVRRRLGLELTATIGLGLMATGIGATGLAIASWMAMGTLAIAGVGMTLAMTGFSTALQARLPEAIRGRVMALWSVAFLGSRPLAAALNGGIADLVSNRAAYLVAAGGTLAIAWMSRPAAISRMEPSIS